MPFISSFLLFYNKSEEDAIKVKCKPVHLEILNHIINSLKINMSEEVNVKAHKILPVAHQFLCNYIFPFTSIKHINPLCGKVVS